MKLPPLVNNTDLPPLVKGGQGRSDHEVRATATTLAAFIGAAMLLAGVIGLVWGWGQ